MMNKRAIMKRAHEIAKTLIEGISSPFGLRTPPSMEGIKKMKVDWVKFEQVVVYRNGVKGLATSPYEDHAIVVRKNLENFLDLYKKGLYKEIEEIKEDDPEQYAEYENDIRNDLKQIVELLNTPDTTFYYRKFGRFYNPMKYAAAIETIGIERCMDVIQFALNA